MDNSPSPLNAVLTVTSPMATTTGTRWTAISLGPPCAELRWKITIHGHLRLIGVNVLGRHLAVVGRRRPGDATIQSHGPIGPLLGVEAMNSSCPTCSRKLASGHGENRYVGPIRFCTNVCVFLWYEDPRRNRRRESRSVDVERRVQSLVSQH